MLLIHRTGVFAVSCLRGALEDVSERIRTFLPETSDWKIGIGEIGGHLSICRQQPLTRTPIRLALWAPLSLKGWTAFGTNLDDGWSHFIAKLAQCRGVESFSLRSAHEQSSWDIQEISYHVAGTYEPRRLIRWLEEEEGYSFLNEGLPLAGEQGWHPSINEVPSRFELLERSKALGFDLLDDRFWKSGGDAIFVDEVWRKRSPAPGQVVRLKWSEAKRNM